MKKLVILGISAFSLGVAAFPAIAEEDFAKICRLPGETSVLQVDKNTIICRTNSDSQIVDKLILYRYCKKDNQSLMSNAVFLTVHNDATRLVGIMEFDDCGKAFSNRDTAFILKGRKFDRWLRGVKAVPELMNRYSQDITRVLNALEKYPVKKPTF